MRKHRRKGNSRAKTRNDGNFFEEDSCGEENCGRGNLPPCRGKEKTSKAERNLGKAEEKISRAEDFFSLFFLSSCLNYLSPGKAEDFSGRGKDSLPSTRAMCLPLNGSDGATPIR